MRKIACRAAHAAANIEHVVIWRDARFRREHVVRLDTAEVVLVVVFENVFRQLGERYAPRLEGVQDLRFVDRMRFIELDNGCAEVTLIQDCDLSCSHRFTVFTAGRAGVEDRFERQTNRQ
jgi:hypothetical protein